MTMDFSRYYKVSGNQALHDALNDMEKTGLHIVQSLDALDAVQIKLFQINFYESIKGIVGVPGNVPHTMPTLARDMKEMLGETAKEVFLRENVFFAMIVVPVSDDSEIITENSAKQNNALIQNLCEDIASTGYDKNFIFDLTQKYTGLLPDKPAKAVLKINGHIFYPEAYRVFADWVIKLPPVIDLVGNDYMLPGCEAINPDDIAKLTAGLPLSDFAHDYAAARERIHQLQKIDLTPRLKR